MDIDIAAQRDRPRTVTSRRSIKYRESSWRVHEFELWSDSLVCRVAALRMEGSLLVWLGGEAPRLGQVALGMPGAGATSLLGGGAGAEADAAQLARRLSVALARPVYVCCGAAFDRFTMPLVERGLVAEIKSRPDCF